MNVADLLTRQALATPRATAIIHDGREHDYAAFESMVWGLCRRLGDHGLRAGDVVGVHLDDPFVHLLAVLALARSGLVAVAIAAEVGDVGGGRKLLVRTGATAMLVGRRAPDWGLPRSIAIDAGIVRGLQADPDASLRVDDPNRLLHYKTSSGTTGEPKIVGASHAGMVASIARETEGIGYPAGERYMTPVSLRFDGPRRRYLACLAAGGTAVMPPGAGGVAALIEAIDRHDVRHYSCVPSQAHELASAVAPGRPRFPRLRLLRLSAGPSDAALHRLLRERLNANVLVSYGCTELGPITVAPPELVATRPQTVGRPLPGIELQIVDAQDRPNVPDTVGLIRIRAEDMPQGYHDDPEATATFFRNGWFYPGDLGKVDEQGLVFHMGRVDGLMIMNGINIYPAEIEQVLLSHPAVRDAVAIPLKHAVANDVPVCAVVLNDGVQASEADLLQFARRRLGSHGPRRVAVLDHMPRNEHGKVRRPELARVLASRLAFGKPIGGAARSAEPGYGGRPRQLSLQVRVSFRVPDRTDIAQVDAWLTDALGLAPSRGWGGQEPMQEQDQRRAQAWLRRALVLTRWLMQAVRIPVLDEPHVVSCGPDPARAGSWLARVAFARIEELSVNAYELAFKGAMRLCAWAATHAPEESTLQTFFELAQDRVIRGLKPLWVPGKSTLPVLREAHRVGIPFTHLGAGVFQLGWGNKAQRIDRSVTGRDSAIGARLCGNKALTAMLLRRAGLPGPEHQVVPDLSSALEAAQRIGWPVVVKPLDRERGEGVFVDVADEDALKAAFEAAHGLSRAKSVIVERQVAGVCHRLFVAHGRLLYAVKRLPMSVQGDGVSDVAGLVADEVARQHRRPPWDRSGIVPFDERAREAIRRAGYTPQAVPAKGVWVPLRRIESTAWGGVDEDVTKCIHPENLRVALAAGELFGLGMAGVDIITADIERPWYDSGAIVNEVNFAPLLGGGEISRSHIPAFLAELVDGAGTIPVDVYVGGEAALEAAQQHWRARLHAGVQTCLSLDNRTLAPTGDDWPMPFVGLYRRTRALVLSPRVQALVLVVRTDEFLATGLPLETVGSVTVVDDQLTTTLVPEQHPAPRERVDAMLRLLRGWAP